MQSLDDVTAYSYVIQGPPAPPNVQNFVVQQNGNAVNFTWTQVDDYALKGYDIGYIDQGGDTSDWHQFILLTEASKGTEMTNASVPAGTWTFGIRARDVADQLSPAIATFDLVIENNNDTTTVQKQEPGWQSAMVGFLRHWTGVLIPDSTTLMSATTSWADLDHFVLNPVSECSYTTPTFDIGFVNNLRIHSTYQITAGPGEASGAEATTYLDAWTTGADPGTYDEFTVATVPVRYLNMKIVYEPIAGAVGYLNDFTYTVDRSPLIEQVQNASIAPGGTAITFDQPFHDVPYVVPAYIGTHPYYASAETPTETSVVIHVWDHSGNDVGGTVTFTARGI
ncbi:hypothetical protein [Roseicella sp. DB1501]|uniref:hypothetical protein n=1 Tax=Roseicella sp. DB1501 TaxID=2730925 RepID=UPI001491BFCE|nr:hypothetical protein [Roseicella sp. DB1501]NOG70515.1 hypothetical protein [Roseicella sp. DB1501]